MFGAFGGDSEATLQLGIPSSHMDRISNLPTELRNHILSFFPSTKFRARTSVLSKKWRYLWLSTPFLDFDASDSAAIIDRCLFLYSLPTLLRLRIESDPTIIGSFDAWISFAASRSVDDLSLSFDRSLFLPFFKPQLPSSLFLCCSLTSLKLTCCSFPQNSLGLGFPSLKALLLNQVSISDNTLDFLISTSPLVETLSVNLCPKITKFKISGARNPFIENLQLAICRLVESDARVVVEDAPRLRFFDYCGNIEKLEIRGVPCLVGADICSFCSEFCKSREDWMGIVSGISNVEVLSVSPWFFQFVLHEEDGPSESQSPMFKNLKEFRWDGIEISKDTLRAIIFFLRECPRLEALYIELDFYGGLVHGFNEDQYLLDGYPFEDIDDDIETTLGEASESPIGNTYPLQLNEDAHIARLLGDDGYLLPWLTMVYVTQFSEYIEEMQLVEFILWKAVSLKLLCLPFLSPNVEVDMLARRISFIPSASPNLKIDTGKSTTKPWDFRTYRHLWDL